MIQHLFRGAAIVCLGAASCAFAANPAAKPPPPMTGQAYEAAKARIEAQYKADRKVCDKRKGDAKDLCVAQAKGREKAEKAQLEARYKPSPDSILAAKIATADANYEVEKQKCGSLQGAAENRCQRLAREGREAAVRQARVEKVESTGGIFGPEAAREGKATPARKS